MSDCSDGSFTTVDLDNINLKSRYFQYKTFFTSPGSASPLLYNVTLDYTLSNQAPVVDSLSLTPSQPKTDNNLTCSFIVTDADAGDSLKFSGAAAIPPIHNPAGPPTED